MVDIAERGMTGYELKAKYDERQPGDHWSEHPEFSHEDWASAASELDTLQGYWDWVSHQIDGHFLGLEDDDEDEDVDEEE